LQNQYSLPLIETRVDCKCEFPEYQSTRAGNLMWSKFTRGRSNCSRLIESRIKSKALSGKMRSPRHRECGAINKSILRSRICGKPINSFRTHTERPCASKLRRELSFYLHFRSRSRPLNTIYVARKSVQGVGGWRTAVHFKSSRRKFDGEQRNISMQRRKGRN
jgi:hypothetical protein